MQNSSLSELSILPTVQFRGAGKDPVQHPVSNRVSDVAVFSACPPPHFCAIGSKLGFYLCRSQITKLENFRSFGKSSLKFTLVTVGFYLNFKKECKVYGRVRFSLGLPLLHQMHELPNVVCVERLR